MLFKYLNSKQELANSLGITLKQLEFYAHGEMCNKYKKIEIPKKRGGVREVYVPNVVIKNIQKKILTELEKNYKPRGCAFAYIKGKNIKQHAEKHQQKRWILRIDLQDFFSSIHFGRVRGIFKYLGCNDKISTYLAQLCCYDGKLPQGASTSPILSNLIVMKMDGQLSNLAKENLCFYTRYCDDIYFSTNRKMFPKNIAFFDVFSSNKFCQVGNDLKEIITKNDFIINDTKVYLANKSNRQFVTGLVVNEKVNINRKFIRNIRPIINKLKTDENFRNEYLKTNKKDILIQLRGKIEFIGYIRGYDDPVYRKYALELSEIDTSYIFNRRNLSFGDGNVVEVYCEGETDYIHLKAILKYFKSKGKFTDLEIRFGDYSEIYMGQNGCLALFRTSVQKNLENEYLTIYIFDADDNATLKELSAYENKLKCQKALVLPTPLFHNVQQYCIEHMYSFDDIEKVRDNEGRRIYLKSEFDDIGFHLKENLIFTNMKKKTLIVDNEIYDLNTKKNVALSKKKFSELITKDFIEHIDLDNFESIFNNIKDLKNNFYKS